MPINTTDERNFRSSYYEKVGCRGVEEKKSLEILLKEKPWDKVKLKQFCYRFTVPAAYRNLIWKVLLGVLPAYTESHEFVMEQRRGHYRDLLHALRVLELAEAGAPLSARLHAMWRLDTGLPTLAPDTQEQERESECGFVWIAESMQQLCDCEVDVYWLSKGLYSVVQTRVEPELPRLLHYTKALLQKEDRELYRFLCEHDRWDAVPLSAWYRRCFAKILDDTSIAKIWDKVCAGGGGVRVLCCCAVVLLTGVRRALLAAPAAAVSPRQHVRDTLAQRVEESEELLANKAIELWHCYSDPNK